ncbi:prepilin-type N-terminal cleavage/methylation domain-containing protein [Flavivirga sp. 57AJ16]|uniref:prepilin-type N-terminal cleavage/methylation domain-containing protein n=1 Tax=Flavivirga sp. 57AJ16 TaxID=3025307 RepID=UPI002366D267|nr:prepilin-type N-terminal cleavage/methylation domain-containing protein [Flavivirga sp. 57AJ16]MDD7886025.1 prepilin-type N-terminal cleavage/methylation domain-containing protein [Flavivirga sp. 57AJ16]
MASAKKNNRYEPTKTLKLPAYNLQEVLIVLVIIGILLLLALPNLMPLISKTKSVEAQTQLKFIYNSQTSYRYMYSKYSPDLNEIDFEAPKTVNENGTSNYTYEILSATNNSFKAKATAITDFDGDGIFNVWEIDENGTPKQIIKD